MKIAPVLLGVSVAVNAALLVVVLRSAPAASPTNASAAHGSVEAGAAEGGATGPGAAAAERERAAAKTVFNWTQLQRGDLSKLVTQLRAAGYPVAVIRAIVAAQIQEQLAGRRRELMAGIADEPYWKGNRFAMNPKVAAAQRELYQEHLRLMKEALGPDATDENELSQYRRRQQFGDVPAEKAAELQRIQADYQELRNEIYSASNGMMMPEDREKLDYLEKELRNDFAKILTPEELLAYDLRSSGTANVLRSQLTTFQPTEEEFRALFQVARSLEEKFGTGQNATYEQTRQRQAAINEQAKLVLSPERYAEFEQATDPRYMMINRVAARYDLPPTVVPQVFAVQQDVQQRAAKLRSLPAAERATQAQALAQEATTKLQPLLGERAFEAYKSYGGQWLRQLTTPPTGATKG